MNMQKGFNLVELMIVVAIIGILASIAVPSYNDYVIRGKLVDASSLLSDGRVKLEQFFQDNRTYVDGPVPAATQYFTFALDPATPPTASTYKLKATGVGTLSLYSYTIDQNNVKTSATPWGNGTTCWIMKKGETC